MSLHKVRERYVKNRTALSNQIRGILHESGIIIPKGISYLRGILSTLYDNLLENMQLHELIFDLYEEFLEVDRRAEFLTTKLETMAKTHEDCKRLMKIPGVGPLTSTLIVAHVGKNDTYKNGRQFAACLGLTPRAHSSGGKQKLSGISKRGNCAIRRLLIQGGLSMGRIWGAGEAGDDRRKQWFQGILQRRNKFIAAVAQANKTARIIYAVLVRGENYKAELA